MLDTEHVAALRAQGHSLRAIAAMLSTSLAAVQRALARRPPPEPVEAESDDPFEVDPRDCDGGELAMLRASTTDVDPAALTPPFVYDRLDDGVLRWRDGNGCSFGEVDMWRWGLRLHAADPDEWAALDAEIEAAKAAAWASVEAAGVVWDADRRRWVQQLRAV